MSAYRKTAQLIIDALIIAVLLTLLKRCSGLCEDIERIFRPEFSKFLHSGLEKVMMIFVFVELFRVLIEYFKEERVKLTYIADATLVFILKEIWVRFATKSISPWESLGAISRSPRGRRHSSFGRFAISRH